jgi:hypothetical protein
MGFFIVGFLVLTTFMGGIVSANRAPAVVEQVHVACAHKCPAWVERADEPESTEQEE